MVFLAEIKENGRLSPQSMVPMPMLNVLQQIVGKCKAAWFEPPPPSLSLNILKIF